jgi:glycosyltransferase involved in cell wall biosynthesis
MEKNLKLLAMLTKREPPSSRLRFRDCTEEFLKNGIETTFFPIPSGPIDRFRLFGEARKYDAVVIQKKTSFHEFELSMLKSFNPNIVFDFDDAVMFHELEHGKQLSGKNVIKFLRTLRYCKAVVAGNNFLAEFARPNCTHVHVLPTPIDTDRYEMKDHSAETGQVIIGWIGVSGNLKYLRMLEHALKEVSGKYKNVVLRIISNESISIGGVMTEFKRWNLEDEIDDLRGLDIGIMPLDDSLWARGKCGYKILQYMGAGLPVVASPVGINADFITHGENGCLASTHDAWVRCLEQLVGNRGLRVKMGEKGYAAVRNKYSLSHYAESYAAILKSLVAS